MTRRLLRPQDLNLIPVMNLVSILIPFLLLGAAFAELGVVDVTAPGIVESVTPAPNPELQLALIIRPSGFELVGADDVLGADRVVPCRDGACTGLESYDFTGLRDRVVRVKDAFPTADTVTITPDERVPYEVIVGALDATRDDGRRELFPRVSLASTVL